MVLNKKRQFIKIYFISLIIPLETDRVIDFCLVCLMGDISRWVWRTDMPKVHVLQRPEYIMMCERIICPLGHPVASECLHFLLERLWISLDLSGEICCSRLCASGSCGYLSTYAWRTCRNRFRECVAIFNSSIGIDWFVYDSHRFVWSILS